MILPYHELEKQLTELVTAASQLFRGQSFEEAQSYIDHDEFLLALDTAFAIIKNTGRRADPLLFADFVRIGNHMQVDAAYWAPIRPLSS